MEPPEFESVIEARVAFKRLTGTEIRLTPFEFITRILQVDDQHITVQIQTYLVDERRVETYLRGRGLKLVAFVQSESGWVQSGRSLTVWETDFEATAINHYGPGKSVGSWLHDRAYARLAHRPGSNAQPMDSFYRTTLGHTPSRMARHW